MIGKELHNYRILKKIGAGGQGAVYKALDTKLDRTVVIKVLPPELTVKGINLKRFEREARLASSLDHPNICTIYDFDSVKDVHFIAMQYVEGRNVRELVNGHPLELRTALSIAVQVCDALAAAHAKGVIHRDIKANNVMVTDTGQAKILDFGLAKLMDDEKENKDIDRRHLTELGIPYGTATYAAPEQARGERADHRADIFSTGGLLYEMLTGIWAFQGKTTVEVRYAVLHETPKPLTEARPAPVPSKLQEILDRALAKDPRDRYQNIAEMRDELRVMLHDISLAEDPSFIKDIAPSTPRRLGQGNSFSGILERIKSTTGLGTPHLALVGVALLALISIPLWVLFGAKSASSGVTDSNVILRLNGSNTIGAKLAPSLVEEFLKQQGAKDIRIVPGSNAEEATVLGILPGNSTPSAIEIRSHGSATAFTDLKEGKSDIGLSSRKIKPDEVQNLMVLGDMTSPASEHILALDGIAVIVNRNNPIDSLTKDQIAEIFSGKITTWSQVLSSRGQIKVYARDDNSGTFDSFKVLVLDNRQLVNSAVRFEDSIALSEAVARDPDGIGFVGLPYIKDAKAVAVTEGNALPLLPNRLTVATEDYLLSRRLYLYTTATTKNEWVRKFVDFTVSQTGQETVGKTGFIAQKVESENLLVVQNAPEEYKNLTKEADRLSLNFRFQKGGKELDNKALTDLDRVVNFITELKLSGQNLLLFGFADDGQNDKTNLNLSKERAMAVADQLTRRGIKPMIVTGFGASLPVASATTEEGREKNRRVELWLKK